MNTRAHDQKASCEHLDRLLAELELKFDLMRLRQCGAELQKQDDLLTQQKEMLEENQTEAAGLGRWWRLLLTKARVLLIETRRGILTERQRWFSFLEDEFWFALRLRLARTPIESRREKRDDTTR